MGGHMLKYARDMGGGGGGHMSKYAMEAGGIG